MKKRKVSVINTSKTIAAEFSYRLKEERKQKRKKILKQFMLPILFWVGGILTAILVQYLIKRLGLN